MSLSFDSIVNFFSYKAIEINEKGRIYTDSMKSSWIKHDKAVESENITTV